MKSIRSIISETCASFLQVVLLLLLLTFFYQPSSAQGGRYWDQNLNSEAALLSGVVVAGESGIAAIYYNPATISEMIKNNLSLSANLFSLYFFKADNALGSDLPADRTELDIYPRIITLTLNPKKSPDLTIELAYFTKANDYLQINKGNSLTKDIITSNPGVEHYTAEYYLRSKYQDYYGGAGFGYRVSNTFRIGFSGIISYKDDQYYNMVNANAFTDPDPEDGQQYLADTWYHLKYSVYDVRLITKLGMHLKTKSWALGANINFPSVKLFGDGTVVKQYDYSNIHKVEGSPEVSSLYYAGRQNDCSAHYKDPMSVAAGANYYSPSGKSILLFTAEYFFGLSAFDYIEPNHDPGEEGYHYGPGEPEEWLSFKTSHKPVLNAGIAFKKHVNDDLMLSGGFRTDFNYLDPSDLTEFPESNKKSEYALNVYHLNGGLGYKFKRGSITAGMQLSYGQENNQKQIVNLTDPVEYISDLQMPLTGPLGNQVTVRYLDISLYLGFMFNFLKDAQ